MDSKGNPVVSSVETYQVQGIRDTFNAYYSFMNQIPATDVRVLLILGLISPTTEPIKDDKIFIDNGWYQVRRIAEKDPANAHIQLQCFAVAAPV